MAARWMRGRGTARPEDQAGAEGCLPVSPDVLRAIVGSYELDPMGIHGLPHWGRVMENGRRLAEAAGADPLVVDLFAIFHDAQRINDGWDPGHGARGAALVLDLRASLPPLTDGQVELLCEACAHHTDGRVHDDPTIGVCWDADRLDLWRVGTPPLKRLLSTETARNRRVMAWARARSRSRSVPTFVMEEWKGVLATSSPS